MDSDADMVQQAAPLGRIVSDELTRKLETQVTLT